MDYLRYLILSQIVIFCLVGCGNNNAMYSSAVKSCPENDSSISSVSDDWSSVEGKFSDDKNIYIRSIILELEDSEITLSAKKVDNSEVVTRYFTLGRFSQELNATDSIDFYIELSMEQFEQTDTIYLRYQDRCFVGTFEGEKSIYAPINLNFKEVK